MSKTEMQSLVKEFIPYEQALELRELGFDELCFCTMYTDAWNRSLGNSINELYIGCGNKDMDSVNFNDTQKYANSQYVDYYVAIPLYQQAFTWFRERYKLFHSVYPIGISTGGKDSYRWRWAAPAIIGEDIIYTDESDLGFLTYKEAELACLKKLIKIVKNK
jgi:hypothetical protein